MRGAVLLQRGNVKHDKNSKHRARTRLDAIDRSINRSSERYRVFIPRRTMYTHNVYTHVRTRALCFFKHAPKI